MFNEQRHLSADLLAVRLVLPSGVNLGGHGGHLEGIGQASRTALRFRLPSRFSGPLRGLRDSRTHAPRSTLRVPRRTRGHGRNAMDALGTHPAGMGPARVAESYLCGSAPGRAGWRLPVWSGDRPADRPLDPRVHARIDARPDAQRDGVFPGDLCTPPASGQEPEDARKLPGRPRSLGQTHRRSANRRDRFPASGGFSGGDAGPGTRPGVGQLPPAADHGDPPAGGRRGFRAPLGPGAEGPADPGAAAGASGPDRGRVLPGARGGPAVAQTDRRAAGAGVVGGGLADSVGHGPPAGQSPAWAPGRINSIRVNSYSPARSRSKPWAAGSGPSWTAPVSTPPRAAGCGSIGCENPRPATPNATVGTANTH